MEEKFKKPPPGGADDGEAAADGKNARPGGKDGPAPAKVAEVGGPKGLDPTRYGDWERKGRCIDF